MVCGGPIIDFFTGILSGLFMEKHPLWLNILVLAIGCVILAFGMTIVIKSDAGTGPNDPVTVVTSVKPHREKLVGTVLENFTEAVPKQSMH